MNSHSGRSALHWPVLRAKHCSNKVASPFSTQVHRAGEAANQFARRFGTSPFEWIPSAWFASLHSTQEPRSGALLSRPQIGAHIFQSLRERNGPHYRSLKMRASGPPSRRVQ